MDLTSYILAKRYVDDTLGGAGVLSGKSAYEIAVQNGFSGTEKQWLESLQGKTPEIGSNGHWIIDGVDTGILATSKDYIDTLLKDYYTKKEIDNGVLIQSLSKEEIEEIITKGD